MMENHHHMSPVYGSDLEFYSTNSTNVKSSNFVAGNNNNISSDAESGFSINVSTGKYNNFGIQYLGIFRQNNRFRDLGEAGGGRERPGETGGDRGRLGETGGPI